MAPDANESEITTMRVRRETLTELDQRSLDDDDSYEDVVRRLLRETEEDISFEAVLRAAYDRFTDTACIYVNHIPTHESPSKLDIWVYTGEASSFEEEIDLFGPEYKIPINRDEGRIRLPFDVYATFDGPKDLDSKSGTPVYMSESVVNSKHLPLEIGLKYLREKLTSPKEWETPRTQSIPTIKDQFE